MFFKYLYRFNKPLCICCILILLTYVWINFKWGAVASPLALYGMYSGVYKLTDTVSVYQIQVDGENLDQSSLSMIEKDIIQSYPAFFLQEKAVNQQVFRIMQPYLQHMGFGKWLRIEKFSNHPTDSAYRNWFKTKLEKILHKPVNQYEITVGQYLWQEGKLMQISVSQNLQID